MNCTCANIILLIGYHSICLVNAEHLNSDYFNNFVVEVQGGKDLVRSVAEEHGYTVIGELQSLPGHYELQHSEVPHRSKRDASGHTWKLVQDNRVQFVSQQKQIFRQKRDVHPAIFERSVVHNRRRNMNDPNRRSQWYIDKTALKRTLRSIIDRTDLGAKECWSQNITGKGVVVSVLDDGVEIGHPDLADNYDPMASYDFNDNDQIPNPRYDDSNENQHGTRCAGEISMVANNGVCGKGIAYDAKIGGVRMLDGVASDSLEAQGLSFATNYIDIYSNSWGPNDDGETTDGPGPLAKKALEIGVNKGRQGKGALYVWASGNGGDNYDNCNNDGYALSIHTISVSGATQRGHVPWYGESCSSTLASTYSGGTPVEGEITTTDLHGQCTESFTGTSAVAPMAAGLFALLLEANPNLTWRDVQHISAYTANLKPLSTQDGWYKNGAGFCVNLAFGHGLLNAYDMVTLADPSSWTSVGEQKSCHVNATGLTFPLSFNSGGEVEVTFTTDGCHGEVNEVNYLEHVTVVTDVTYSSRGHVYVEIESPMGTVTPLMTERKFDSSRLGFRNWPLMSTHNWGERPAGTWTVRVADRSRGSDHGSVDGLTLVLYGTTEQPQYQKAGPKDCDVTKSGTLGVEDPSDAAMEALHQLSLAYNEMTRQKRSPPFVSDIYH